MNHPAPLLDVRDLSVTIQTPMGPLSAVRGIDLTLQAGETLCIVGESGSGKSMTSLALMGLLPPRARARAGHIRFGADALDPDAPGQIERLRGDRIAMIFQEPMTALNPTLTLGEQLVEGLLHHDPSRTRAAATARAVELLSACGVADPERRLTQYPHQLSGGLRQRVMIAMALMTKPDLLIADEPTTALDRTISLQILALLKDLQKRFDLGLILVTHDFDVVREVADHICVVYAGEIVETGTRDQVLNNPAHPYTRALLSCVPTSHASADGRLGFLPGVVPSLIGPDEGCQFRDRCALAHAGCAREAPWQEAGTGHRIRCTLAVDDIATLYRAPVPPAAKAYQPDQNPAQPALEVRGVIQRYTLRKGLFGKKGQLTALRGIDLSVNKGEVLGLVGESGSGKSTLARAMLGIERPAEGAVLINGQPISSVQRTRRARLVQPVLQDPYSSLNPRRTVEDTIRLPLDIHGIGTVEERRREVRRMMDLCGLPTRTAGSFPSQMSGGQRQRVAIASALVLRPEILICDEPTSALDVSVQAQILNLLKDLRAEFNLTLVMISHDLGVIRAMSDRVAVMYFGRIVEVGTGRDLFEHPQHPYTELLLGGVAKVGGQGAKVTGTSPNPLAPPQGCSFSGRCPRAVDRCQADDPLLAGTARHAVACHVPA